MPEPDSNAPKPEPSPPAVPVPAPSQPPARRKEKEEASFDGLISHLFASNKGGAKNRNKEGGEMGLLDHLEELRATIVKCVMALGAGIVIMGLVFPYAFDALQWPLVTALGPAKANDVLRTNSPLEIYNVIIQVVMFGAIFLALPFIGNFVIRFVAPGLTLRERSILRPALLSALALFLFGAEGCFFIILPAAINVSDRLGLWLHMPSLWSATQYYGLVVWCTLGMGVLFEFPLVLVILQMLGIVETQTLRRYWRQAIVVILLLASVVAPTASPDSMLEIAVPMVLLYVGSLIVGARMRKKYLARQAQKEAEEQAAGL